MEERVRLFVCAVGVPPPDVVKRLHDANCLVMNMIGLPKHCTAALAAGVDMVCAQGTEAGGHTGDLATSVLVPAVVYARGSHAQLCATLLVAYAARAETCAEAVRRHSPASPSLWWRPEAYLTGAFQALDVRRLAH